MQPTARQDRVPVNTTHRLSVCPLPAGTGLLHTTVLTRRERRQMTKTNRGCMNPSAGEDSRSKSKRRSAQLAQHNHHADRPVRTEAGKFGRVTPACTVCRGGRRSINQAELEKFCGPQMEPHCLSRMNIKEKIYRRRESTLGAYIIHILWMPVQRIIRTVISCVLYASYASYILYVVRSHIKALALPPYRHWPSTYSRPGRARLTASCSAAGLSTLALEHTS